MRSKRGAGFCALLGVVLGSAWVVSFVPAGLADGGGDLATAHALTPGVPFHGATTDATNDFSRLALRAGDYLTVDWNGGKNTLDLLPSGTTDATPLDQVKPLFSLDAWTETLVGAVHKLSQRYLVKTSGTYVFRAGAEGLPPGTYPYTLTVYRQHGAQGATCPMRVQASFAAGRVLTLRITEPGVRPSSPAGLGVMVWMGRRRTNGSYAPLDLHYGDTVAAGHGSWTFVAMSQPQRAGQFKWIVSPQSVVRDARGYFCIPAIVGKTLTAK